MALLPTHVRQAQRSLFWRCVLLSTVALAFLLLLAWQRQHHSTELRSPRIGSGTFVGKHSDEHRMTRIKTKFVSTEFLHIDINTVCTVSREFTCKHRVCAGIAEDGIGTGAFHSETSVPQEDLLNKSQSSFGIDEAGAVKVVQVDDGLGVDDWAAVSMKELPPRPDAECADRIQEDLSRAPLKTQMCILNVLVVL